MLAQLALYELGGPLSQPHCLKLVFKDKETVAWRHRAAMLNAIGRLGCQLDTAGKRGPRPKNSLHWTGLQASLGGYFLDC